MYYIILFIQGLLSFFYPCVLPMIPLYMSYITSDLDSNEKNYQKKVFINTSLFILGIWTTFLILSVLFSVVGSALGNYKDFLIVGGGLLIILFGLHHLNIIQFNIFNFQKNIDIDKKKENNYLASFMLGLIISFSWSPCIGPVLSSILVLVTTHGQILTALLQMLIYVIGFTIPFLLLGLFTTRVMKWLNQNRKIISYTKLIGGFLILVTGLYLVFNQGLIIYKRSTIGAVFDKTYTIENSSIRLKDSLGKKVIIYFLDSSCNQCFKEIPVINEYYEKNKDQYSIIAIVKNSHSVPEKFIKELNMPTIYDDKKELFLYFDINQTPSYIILDKDLQLRKQVIGLFKESDAKEILDSIK